MEGTIYSTCRHDEQITDQLIFWIGCIRGEASKAELNVCK